MPSYDGLSYDYTTKAFRVETVGGSSDPVTLALAPTDSSPTYNNLSLGGINIRTDSAGNLQTFSEITTDQGTGRANWTGSTIGFSPGSATFTNGSNTVTTTSGFSTTDLKYLDFIKLSSDGESAYAQVSYINSDTSITLINPYTGTTGTGAYTVTRAATVTGAGATISVASGQLTLAAGTQAVNSAVYKSSAFPPLQNISGSHQLSISQRIANQDIYVGLESATSSPRYFARFHFTGTTNTQVITETAYNPTTVPSASETETNTITLPNGANTASINTYKIDYQYDQVIFSINGVVVATHIARLPQIWTNFMNNQIRVISSATVTNTNIVSNFIFSRAYARIDTNLTNPSTSKSSDYPAGAIPLTAASGNVANASATATLAGVTGKTTYITGFEATGAGATAGSVVTLTITGTVSGTLTYVFAVPTGAVLTATPLIIPFPRPIPASASSTSIVTTLPALGTGNTNAAVVAHGYQL